MDMDKEEENGPIKTIDTFRDTPVRYLGYTNEVGESFRQIIGSKWVNFSYGIATLYVLADTSHKSNEMYRSSKGDDASLKKTLFATADCFLWQMLASVVLPGVTINRACAFSNYVLKKSGKFPKKTRKILVTAIGLVSIPFIIKPIDELVDKVLDNSIRVYKP